MTPPAHLVETETHRVCGSPHHYGESILAAFLPMFGLFAVLCVFGSHVFEIATILTVYVESGLILNVLFSERCSQRDDAARRSVASEEVRGETWTEVPR